MKNKGDQVKIEDVLTNVFLINEIKEKLNLAVNDDLINATILAAHLRDLYGNRYQIQVKITCSSGNFVGTSRTLKELQIDKNLTISNYF